MPKRRVCRNYEKLEGEQFCKHFIGFKVIEEYGVEKEIVESCACRCGKPTQKNYRDKIKYRYK